MKKILCFGDSNTYGFNPKDGSRYNKDIRWTALLQNTLKGTYNITEAGCNNRTAFSDNPAGLNFTGYKILPEYLKENFDIIIFQIGINDLQKSYNTSLTGFEKGMEKFFSLVKHYSPYSKIIILSPCVIKDNILNSYFNLFFDEKSIEKSKQIFSVYEKIAKKNKYQLIDLNKFTETSNIDGLHYAPEQHNIICNEIVNCINLLN